jgi:hypothetical protein
MVRGVKTLEDSPLGGSAWGDILYLGFENVKLLFVDI